MPQITPTLKELGLTEGEIKVYLALIELGQTTVGPIAKLSGISHAKVYPILDKLIEKGLVSHNIKENRKNFIATNPNNLLEFINKKQTSLEEEKQKIKRIIPSLINKQGSLRNRQYARVFEGLKAITELFREIFSQHPNQEILVFGLNDILKQDKFIHFFHNYHPIRKQHNIKLKLILNKNQKEKIRKDYKSLYTKHDKIKYLDTHFPTGIFIFHDHVITIVADNQITAFDIKSQQNAQHYKDFFNSFWNKP
ncbi:hypothetical protein CMI48_04045 [Candidatus Pacearchaeota archaeon]|jgi:sugar-specific transcriptional regulator TrmB|nr:hypothetical protein [Candidatus Pacearchaeota archaeon]